MLDRKCIAVVLLLFGGISLRAETVFVSADRDTTLIEDPDGALSNGSGPVFFVGQTNQQSESVRRGLVRFDVAAAIPADAIVEAAVLHLTALPGNSGASAVAVARVVADWGEGASSASGGRGAPAEPGDATWIHTFYDTDFWRREGGHFVGRASGEFMVRGPGEYAVPAGPAMLADVRLWKAAPARNFGWILIGDETRPQSVHPFASRESLDPDAVPVLEIVYRLPRGRS